MIEVIYIPNRLKPEDRLRRMCEYRPEYRIRDYIRQIDGAPRKISIERHSIIVSGESVYGVDIPVKNHSQIILTNRVEWPAVAAIGDLIWAGLTYAAAHPFVAAATLATMYSVYSALTTKARMPYSNGSGGLDDGSATYAWDGISNTSGSGNPIPIVYGEHKVGGHILNEYISQEGEDSYYNVLLAVASGEIEDISDIKFNGNPIANYDGITTYKRYGTNSDALIPHFEDLHNLYSLSNIELTKDNAYQLTTLDADVEGFELHLGIVGGLFAQEDNQGIQSWSVGFRVRYKLESSGTWTDLGVTTISKKTRSTIKYIFRKDGLTAGKYDIEVTRTTNDPDFTHFGDLYLQHVDELKTADLIYPNVAKLAVRALAVEQLSGSAPTITSIVKGRKISIPKVTIFATGEEQDWEDYYWDPDYDSGAGAYRLFADDTVLYWDESTWVDRWCANPIWCMKDLLTNDLFGLGKYIDTSLMDDAELLEMSRYCEEKMDDGAGGYEKRFRMDIVVDSFNSAVDLVNQLTSIFNGYAFWSGNRVKIAIDRPSDPVQLFGMGNILSGGFQQSWKSLKDVSNVVEVTFTDKDKDYEQETIEVVDEDSVAAGDPIRKTSIRVFCTSMSQALRIGRYALKVAQNIDRTISLKVGIDALACQIGDVISVSHDVVQWGFSGNVKTGATTTSIPIDRTITVESGKSYVLRIRKSDDTIEEKTVSNAAGSHSTITVSSAFSFTPARGDVYTFGESGIAAKDFRIVKFKRLSSDECEITGIEYNEAVYDDSAVTIPQNNYSALNLGVPPVQDLSLDEHLVMGGDGTFESAIDVYFQRPDDADYYVRRYKQAVIYWSDNDGDSWEKAGITDGEHFIIYGGVTVGSTYKIAVVSVSAQGEEAAFSTAEVDSITILGKEAPPDDVTGFNVEQRGDKLRLSWNPIDDLDLARYVIRKGPEWSSGQLVAEKVDVTEFEVPVGTVGLETYMIKAVDTSGNESDSAATDEITVTPPPEMNFAVQLDPWNIISREYNLSNVAIEQRNLYDPDYTRDVFALATAETWEEKTGGWDTLAAAGDLTGEGVYEASGYVEQPADQAFDLGTIFEFNVVTDMDYQNVAGGSITVQISTSEDLSSWSAFANVSSSTNYRARYIRFKYILATSDTEHNIYWYSGLIYINAANVKVDYGRDVAIDAGGTAILFRDDFTATPRITCLAIKNGILGVVEVTSISSAGMTIKVRNLADTAYIATAEVDWEVKGS